MSLVEPARDHVIDERGACRDDQPGPDMLERARRDETVNRGVANGEGRDQDQRALQAAREVLGLGVAENMVFVWRARGYADHRQRDGGADDVDRSLDGIGEQPDRVGEPPRQHLERNGHQRRDDRQCCELARA